MTKDCLGLHSHSGLERELMMPKHRVLVDFKFAPMFDMSEIGEIFTKNKIRYVEVDTSAFVKRGGVFKNYNE